MNLPRRIYLFARDYLNEFPLVWSLARTHDCDAQRRSSLGHVQVDDQQPDNPRMLTLRHLRDHPDDHEHQ